MRQLSEYVARARSMPPHVLALKIGSLVARKARRTMSRAYYQSQKSYSGLNLSFTEPLFQPANPQFVERDWPRINALNDKTLQHQFDLLGSGWREVNMPLEQTSQIRTAARLNAANRGYAKSIYDLIDPDYRFIDWHLDFKSNYRWQPQQWWEDVPYGHKPGVDIKVPWELSRMQHLPWLAYGFQKQNDPKYQREFQNQLLDFIASNPPRFGVNWKCPMDVAIRAANWITAFDLFRGMGAKFSADFEKVVARSLFDHGLFVQQNFEKATDFRGNHYLADIAGLTFIAFAITGHPLCDEWRDLCADELLKEADYQFHSIGTNFEGSTAYHRLSSEMLIYPMLVVEKRSPGYLKNNDNLKARILGLGSFSKHCTTPKGEIVQIGDNDSGRFLKLSPNHDKDLDEQHLDHQHLQDLVETLFGKTARSIETSIVENSFGLNLSDEGLKNKNQNKITKSFAKKIPHFLEKAEQKQRYQFTMPKKYREDLQAYCYSDFGLCLFKSEDFFLSFRCGPVGQLGRGGHDHNDQLAIELYSNGRFLVRDPGTYLYTPEPEARNRYRSNQAHFCPQPEDQEMGDLSKGLFFIEKATAGDLIEFSQNGCLGWHQGFGFPLYRKLSLLDSEILVEDFAFSKKALVDLGAFKPLPYSPGYGLKEN